MEVGKDQGGGTRRTFLARSARLAQALAVQPAGREDWRQLASCGSADPDMFWPEAGEYPSAALALCVRCPVLGDCRESFVHSGRPDVGGVWFATTEPERRRHARAVRLAVAA